MRKWLPHLLLLAPVLLPAQAEMHESKKTPNNGPDCVALNSDYLQQHKSVLAASGGYETAAGKILKVSQTRFTTPYDNDVCVCLKPETRYETLLMNCLGISNAPDSLVACDPDKKARALELEVDLCRYRGSHCVEDDADLALLKRALESLEKAGATVEARGVRVDDLKHDGGKSELHPVELITAQLSEPGRLRHRVIAGKNNPGPHPDKRSFWPPQAYDDRKPYALALPFPEPPSPGARPVCEVHEYVNRRSAAGDCYTLRPATLGFTYQPESRMLLGSVTAHLARGNGKFCRDKRPDSPRPPVPRSELSSESTGLLIADIITRWEDAPQADAAAGADDDEASAGAQPVTCAYHRNARWEEPGAGKKPE